MRFKIVVREGRSYWVEAEKFHRSPLDQPKGTYHFVDKDNHTVGAVECDAVVGVFEDPEPGEK